MHQRERDACIRCTDGGSETNNQNAFVLEQLLLSGHASQRSRQLPRKSTMVPSAWVLQARSTSRGTERRAIRSLASIFVFSWSRVRSSLRKTRVALLRDAIRATDIGNTSRWIPDKLIIIALLFFNNAWQRVPWAERRTLCFLISRGKRKSLRVSTFRQRSKAHWKISLLPPRCGHRTDGISSVQISRWVFKV